MVDLEAFVTGEHRLAGGEQVPVPATKPRHLPGQIGSGQVRSGQVGWLLNQVLSAGTYLLTIYQYGDTTCELSGQIRSVRVKSKCSAVKRP